MARLKADLDVCEGYGNCVAAAPEYFDIDDDGKVVVLRPEVGSEEYEAVDDGVRACPVNALLLET